MPGLSEVFSERNQTDFSSATMIPFYLFGKSLSSTVQGFGTFPGHSTSRSSVAIGSILQSIPSYSSSLVYLRTVLFPWLA